MARGHTCNVNDCFANSNGGTCKHPSNPKCVQIAPKRCPSGHLGCDRTEAHVHTPGLGRKLDDLANEAKEQVNHPSHYGGDTTYETIKVIEAWGLDFCLGNAIKYISRAGKKDQSKTLEDLEKAAWYLQRRIEQLKR